MAEDPAAGAVADLAPVLPPSDVQGATARKAQLMADPAFRDRYLGNNAEARSEMSALNAAIVAAGSSELSQSTAFEVEHLRNSGASEEVVQQFMKREPISETERGLALQWKASHLRDRAWVEKFSAGDIVARREMATASMLLSLPTKPAA